MKMLRFFLDRTKLERSQMKSYEEQWRLDLSATSLEKHGGDATGRLGGVRKVTSEEE